MNSIEIKKDGGTIRVRTHIIIGISSLIRALVPAAIIYAIILFVLVKSGKRKKIRKSKCICEYLYFVCIWTILEITGIIGMQFQLQWFADSLGTFGFYIPGSMGELMMQFFNICLFIPVGILTPYVFPKKFSSPVKVILGLMVFSICIEVLQMFSGRFFEINDILANTIGAGIGYIIFIVGKKSCDEFNV